MAFAKTLKEQKLHIFCDYCFRNITFHTYYRCEDCKFDSCEACFFQELETDIHKKTHKFRVISNLETCPDSSNWRMIDELLLLDGLLSCGFGNFDDISKILPAKDQNEVKKHFYELVGIVDNEDGEKSFEIIPKSNPNDSFIASFMSKRKEFDSEILNEYEALIENLIFEDDDSELDTEFKRYLLNNYKTVLKRRKVWRNFIFDRNLTDVERYLDKEKTDIGEVAGRLKWLAQFISKNDFNVFIAGLVREKRLKESLSKNPEFLSVQSENLMNNTANLSEKELKLCIQLKLAPELYIKLKKMAIERYLARLPLKAALLGLFRSEDHERVMVLYKWFLDQNIVIEN
ncbi:uncharacterized protein VICG_00541 [Vittaforma corneae ATCC 50505]|uniref:C2H2-type domain-containing protein n=1 Tax=Vittaforma corneae (strain ATCC 50505) TaxID=993615 RepID=L2GQ37_VITCO|nr:uncharacterized protein VICG_00541 [Vittaforma corneae ATCC 50505]ELA42442.1 hypothetical protein VICG_00541 [Vittaforma corneae ATCC 50505]